MSASQILEQEGPGVNAAPDLASRFLRWSRIAERTVYFGHQSVGASLCTAVGSLASEQGLPLKLITTHEPEKVIGPAIVSFHVGRHRDCASKNAAILRLLESRTRAGNPVVLLKYCHGDIVGADDYAMLFNAYRDTVEMIQFEHPDVTVVHSTIPLTAVESSLRARARRYLGRTTRRQAAVGRHRYNELVRAEFGLTQPLFDVARVQATGVNGIATFRSGRNRIEVSAPENTVAGVNLSSGCLRAAAESLLDVLSAAVEAS
jgi:hypothetical protein